MPQACKEEENPLVSDILFAGIEEIVTNQFTLKCMQTNTAIKLMLISNGADKISQQDSILRKAYEIYSDFVGKNPFQEADMPIKSELFDSKVS